MSKTIFPIDPELTAIAVAYSNKRLIADEVMPRVQVGRQEFKYRVYALADGFTLPDTKVGRLSAPNRVEFGFTETSGFTKDYALDDGIPESDVANAPPNYSPRGHAVEMITNLIALDREKRVADIVFGAANYGSSNKTTLSGTSQWSHSSSTPLSAITAALDACVMRPNIMVLSRAVYSKLRAHAQIVAAVLGNAGTVGLVPGEAIRDLFELEALYVGEAWLNSAKPGQTVSLSQTWGKHCALLYRDKLANATSGVTFGFTAQFGSRVSGAIQDPDCGMRGGERVRVGESVAEVVTASDLGYLFVDAVA